jgi:mRNA interferase MazF
MNVRRGDVVLVAFPFSTGSGSKRRPAVIVQSDRNNALLSNTIVAAITTTTHRANEASQLFIDPQSTLGIASGLLMPSAVTCENLATIERSRITRVIGQLPPDGMLRIDACLCAALGI